MVNQLKKKDNKLFILKWRIYFNMKPKNKDPPCSIMVSRQINLSDFGFEKPALKILKEIKKGYKSN